MEELRTANTMEHELLQQSERNNFIFKTFFALLITVIAVVVLFMTRDRSSATSERESTSLINFTETEASIITELYGDRTAYADGKTWHTKTNFIDKEKTAATGEITYDEEAYQAYYDSFLAEYDANIDYEKVASILEERKAAFLAASVESAKETEPIPVNNTGLLLSTLYILLIGTYIILSFMKYNCIRTHKYRISDGKVLEKRSRRGRINLVKPYAMIRYGSTSVKVRITYLQSLSINVGDSVYLAHFDTNLPIHTLRYTICKSSKNLV